VSIDVLGVTLREEALDQSVVNAVFGSAEVERRRVEAVAQECDAGVDRHHRVRCVPPTDITPVGSVRVSWKG
jgi:hypothetical protein